MKLKKVFEQEDLSLAFAIVLLLFTPLIGGYWWWPLTVSVVIILLALECVLKRTLRWNDQSVHGDSIGTW